MWSIDHFKSWSLFFWQHWQRFCRSSYCCVCYCVALTFKISNNCYQCLFQVSLNILFLRRVLYNCLCFLIEESLICYLCCFLIIRPLSRVKFRPCLSLIWRYSSYYFSISETGCYLTYGSYFLLHCLDYLYGLDNG